MRWAGVRLLIFWWNDKLEINHAVTFLPNKLVNDIFDKNLRHPLCTGGWTNWTASRDFTQ